MCLLSRLSLLKSLWFSLHTVCTLQLCVNFMKLAPRNRKQSIIIIFRANAYNLFKQASRLPWDHICKQTHVSYRLSLSWFKARLAPLPVIHSFSFLIYFIHLFPTNQGSDNASMLAGNKLCTNKQKLSSQRQLRPTFNPCIHPTKPALSPIARQNLQISHFHFISRIGGELILK